MWVRCVDCPVRSKPLFRPFAPDELEFVSNAKTGQIDITPRSTILDASTNGEEMFSLLAGWAFRFKALPNGDRQILDFLLPGDLIGLQAPMVGRLKHGVIALTSVTVCEIASGPIQRLFEAQPALGAALMQTLLVDDDRADRRLLMLGRQRPTQRLAYLLLELFERMELRLSVHGATCSFPLTYVHLADALGLSRAQLARSVAEIRDRGWARMQNGQLEVMARDEMAAYASYDGASEREQRALI
jgi:CRP/FNR family transcriptional regulator